MARLRRRQRRGASLAGAGPEAAAAPCAGEEPGAGGRQAGAGGPEAGSAGAPAATTAAAAEQAPCVGPRRLGVRPRAVV